MDKHWYFEKQKNAVWRKIEWTCTYKHLEKQTNVVFGKNKRTNISKKSTCSFAKSSFKNEWTNISKKKANAVWRKTNGQTFPKTAKCSLEKKRTGKHFEKQTKVVLGKFKYKRTNIFKKKQMQFLEIELQKKIWPWTNIKFQKKANAVWRNTNGQTFRKTAKCSLEKTDKHFEKQTNVL